MASGVNVKMGVSGIAQFKQNMQVAKNSLKTVDEQLKLNEKQFKATGDSEAYMQQKSELLKVKLEEQKAMVEQAEKALQHMTSQGVDKSSKAFQDMQQQLLRAQGDLLDTQVQMQGVESASDDAADGISDMNDELGNIGKQVSFQTVTDGIDKITDGLKNAAKKAFQMGQALVQATLGAGAWADELVTTATMYKELDPTMTPEKLQRMRKTADLIDTNVESIMNSKQKLASAMGKNDIDEIFAGFGIQNTRYGEFENLEDMFWSVGEAVMKVENETKRAQLGKKLFGDWTALAPLFAAGREEYEKTMEAQSVVSDEAIDSLGKLDDEYQKLQNEVETTKNEFLGAMAPALTSVMETLTGLVKEFNEYLATPEGKEMLDAMQSAVKGLFQDISNIDPQEVMEGFKGAFDAIIEGFKWIDENKENIVKALEFVVAGWAALKLTGGALKIWQFITGIQGLAGAGTAAGGATAASAAASAGATAGNSWAASFASAATAVLGAAGLAAIVFGFKEAAAKRNNTPELVRGTEENFAKEASETSDDVVGAFINYVEAQKAVQDLLSSPEYSDEKMNELLDAVDSAQEALMALEGSDKILKAYSDWRQENSLGNDDWILPDGQFLEESATTIGENTAIGLANGIEAKKELAIQAAYEMADGVQAAMEGALEINSPSKVMQRLGEFVSAGFAEGIDDGLGRVNGAVDGMARAAESVSGRGGGGTAPRMIDVTLMIGPDKLTEVIVPLVDNTMGEEINLMRR